MSERYWITGAQLGILEALDDSDRRRALVDQIVDKQFILNAFTDDEKDSFEGIMKTLKLKKKRKKVK